MKPVIQREFDDIFENYPTDLGFIREKIPVGGDPYERKRVIAENAAEFCPVHVFAHYPFAFEMDMGEPREVCYIGIGNECRSRSGVDFSPLQELRKILREHNLGSFNDYSDHLHRTLDHDKLLRVGFRGVYEECQRLNADENDPDKRKFRELLMVLCKCVEKIGLRLRALPRTRTPDTI